METISRIKLINIKELIENETSLKFSNRNLLEECPFCGSGKGNNHSPAFSINIKGNYYKCFSCGSKGSTIDFMMNINSEWKEYQSISYLKEKYLGIIHTPYISKEMTPIEKTAFAIKNNPKQNATEYLQSRKIKTSILPIDCYYYDSHTNAVVFVDAEHKLINRRMIKPAMGYPKAKNQGSLNDSIYDKLFRPNSDTVYIHEGVINALSMPDYSSVALFSTENKVHNTTVLQRYVEGKHIVLAMDNDNAGNKCAEYYHNFLLNNRFNILSLRRIIFPEGIDTNDLLKNGEMKEYIKDQNNYNLLWEDIVTKPIPTNSEDIEADNDEYSFFTENGCYYMKETIKGKPIVKKLTNFLMESVYHLMDGTKESTRLIKFQRNTGEVTVNEIMSSELNLERLKKVIRSVSSRGLTFFGSTQYLDYILTYMYDREKNAIAINKLGYQNEYKSYCFADALITEDNTLVYPDKLGIVSHGNTSLYLPPFAYTNLKDKGYDVERRFTYKGGNLNFNTWAELIYKAYNINGTIGISFVILALYRDIIQAITGFFPFLFLFGDQGAGKSNFVNFFLHLFGEPNHGISLLNSTDKGFSRSLTQRSNALYYLKEYSNAIDKKTVDVFKTGYDGELYTMAQKSNDNKTTTLEISSACMVDGNELPTSEAALFARMIVLHFEDNKFSDESTQAYKTLLKEKEYGFGNITRELLKYRRLIEQNFKPVFEKIFHGIKSQLIGDTELSDRQIRHIALLLAPVKVLEDKLTFPVSFEVFKEAIIENAKKQNEMASDLKDSSIFWNAIAYKISSQYSDFRPGTHYIKDQIKKILYIKFKLLYPIYVDYVTKNKLHFLEMNSLRELLTAKGNKSFVPNNSQKSRKTKSYTHKTLGSCYMYKYDDTENSKGIIVDGVELNI